MPDQAPDESPSAMFQRTIRMDEPMAKALVRADVTLLEELAYVPLAELMAIDGIQEPVLNEFRQRARAYLLNQALDGQELPPGPLGQDD